MEIDTMLRTSYLNEKRRRVPVTADDFIEDALIAEKWGRFDDALYFLDKAITEYPSNAICRGIKASILSHLGKIEKAENELLSAVSLEPQCWNFYNDLAHAYLRLDLPSAALENLVFAFLLLMKSEPDNDVQNKRHNSQMMQGLFFRLGLMNPEVQKRYLARKMDELHNKAKEK